jgi:hypothetical protein
MLIPCESHIFNCRFAHFLYGDGQEVGKKWKPNISLLKIFIDFKTKCINFISP